MATTLYEILTVTKALLISGVADWTTANVFITVEDSIEVEVSNKACIIHSPRYTPEGFKGGLEMKVVNFGVTILWRRLVDHHDDTQILEEPLKSLCRLTKNALRNDFLSGNGALDEPLEMLGQDPPVRVKSSDSYYIRVPQRWRCMYSEVIGA